MDEETNRFPLHTAARGGQGPRDFYKRESWVNPSWYQSDPKLSKRKDDDGRFPIHWAASSNCYDIVALLANQSGFDPDVQDESGWTPLMISASVPDSERVLKVLLQRGADVNGKNSSGQTALHFVASKKNMDVARLLLVDSKPSASTRVRDRRGQYPIHRAAAAGSAPMVSLLLENRSPLNPADSEGFTPLHHAIAEGHGDVAVMLLKEGADHTLKDSEEELALDLAPDKEVRRYIMQGAEREGIDLFPQ